MHRIVMTPAPGERLLRFTGDRAQFRIRTNREKHFPPSGKAFLRTNLGRAGVIRRETIRTHHGRSILPGASWRDIPMEWTGEDWMVELTLTEPGFFQGKPYLVDGQGRQHWPDGADAGISVHPDNYRTSNTIYCAFTRMFGPTKREITTGHPMLESQLSKLDKQGYSVIPPSGKLRDLERELPHIFERLGCRILHLLPLNPTPTTYARFGRFGSPYACQDLTAIDPALVEFDRRTTGVDQFKELAFAVHSLGGKVFLDVVINHTGWGSTLQENHPEWFLRDEKGDFVSPGAWGVTWEDLVEMDHSTPAPWKHLSDVFLTWLERGVDGFRCDAGYKVPPEAWKYIIAQTRSRFPDAIFLLEGLGGAWEATETLLTDGGMQWAYSELFQNFSGVQVAGYLDHSFKQSSRVGVLVHYSETHDNERLAKKGRIWSLLRNRLCALSSANGAFGFTCGVEWLAEEKINVHQSRGLAWDSAGNLVPELALLNRLLAEHPCFFDGATCERLSPVDSDVFAFARHSAEGQDHLLVLINLDAERSRPFEIEQTAFDRLDRPAVDLLGQVAPLPSLAGGHKLRFNLPPAASYCLSHSTKPKGLAGEAYRSARAAAAWAVSALSHLLSPEEIGPFDWRVLAQFVNRDPAAFLEACLRLDKAAAKSGLLAALEAAGPARQYHRVVRWTLADRTRILMTPPGHWLVLEDQVPFRARLEAQDGTRSVFVQSSATGGRHLALINWALPRPLPPKQQPFFGEATLHLERYSDRDQNIEARVIFLKSAPAFPEEFTTHAAREGAGNSAPLPESRLDLNEPIALLTNALGGMARLCVDLGKVKSKYDCLLGANLHPDFPVDRHVLAKRLRVWINANGFITPLNAGNLLSFKPGPPAEWHFEALAGDGNLVPISMTIDMLDQSNTTIIEFRRPETAPQEGRLLAQGEVSLSVRVDIEDRNFHGETKRNAGADHHFFTHSRPLSDQIGFEFTPAADRRLAVFATSGAYYHESEWSENIPHPVEQTRGHQPGGDTFSPGWFDLPLAKHGAIQMIVTAEPTPPPVPTRENFITVRQRLLSAATQRAQAGADTFAKQLAIATQAFIVRRDRQKTVIAGYPWFLDWGRDSLICARGLLAAGLVEEVQQLLVLFGRFESSGTMPNTIHGADVSNRDTSDAPLWYAIVCEEAAAILGTGFYDTPVDERRSIRDVLVSLADNYASGTPNGIRMDPDSGLIWSPAHFTWMDTNYPAGTPREGYPVEIQVLWLRLLKQLEKLRALKPLLANALARAEQAFSALFWLESQGRLSDCLHAPRHGPATQAVQDDALRSNYLFAVTLGAISGWDARRAVDAAVRHLILPGALRSLAPLPVRHPAPIYSASGSLLNDPSFPYWPVYEGDEDTRRKPAYHNGTAWVWTFPTFCEALAQAWGFSRESVAAAKAYLGSLEHLLCRGCLGQLPEILDGDAPHQDRGCDAQSWSVTEAFRVWRRLTASA